MNGLEEIKNLARQAETLLVPKISQASYIKEYEKFLDWLKSKNIEVVNEMLMLAYMMELVTFTNKLLTNVTFIDVILYFETVCCV